MGAKVGCNSMMLWSLIFILNYGKELEGMAVSNSTNMPDRMDPFIRKSDAQKRPVLKHGSFGFSHAQHLNPEYYDGHKLEASDYFRNNTGERAGQHQVFFRRRRIRINANRATARPKASKSATPVDDACKESKMTCDRMTRRFRTSDGSCNNLRNPSWGKSGTAYRRMLTRKHSIFAECGGKLGLRHLPNPRLLSRLLNERLPAEDGTDLNKGLSMYLVLWGQFVDHDMILTPLRQTGEGEFLDCCDSANDDAPECCSIRAPRGDFFYGRGGIPDCIPFLRSKLTDPVSDDCDSLNLAARGRLNSNKPTRDVENRNTHFLDASHVYGSNQERENALRTFKGGLMKSSPDRRGRAWPPLIVDGEAIRMEFGDTRGDVTPAFTLLATLSVRLHNKVAKDLAIVRPDWDDERLFQETRKIVTAIFQHITYTQWMDALLGVPNDLRTNDRRLHQDFYKPGVDPSVSSVFSTSAFRLHTTVAGSFHLRNSDYRMSGEMMLAHVFHQPLKLLENATTFDDLIRGLTLQPAWEFNNKYAEDMTEMLFNEENNGTFGMDIIALNVQRGRDHQIQSYAAYRESCGLGAVNSWNDMSDFIHHNLVHKLLHAYQRPEDADMYIASNMEDRVPGSILGPTVHCLIREQFERTRDGDRHFYTRPPEFNRAQLLSIKRAGSLSRVLCDIADESGKMRLPRNVFKIAHLRSNPFIPCSRIPRMLDLRPWARIE